MRVVLKYHNISCYVLSLRVNYAHMVSIHKEDILVICIEYLN